MRGFGRAVFHHAAWIASPAAPALVARHVRHHRDPRINFNLLLPLGDLLFGTLAEPRGSRNSEPRRGSLTAEVT